MAIPLFGYIEEEEEEEKEEDGDDTLIEPKYA
jgi:hypothetical protein